MNFSIVFFYAEKSLENKKKIIFFKNTETQFFFIKGLELWKEVYDLKKIGSNKKNNCKVNKSYASLRL